MRCSYLILLALPLLCGCATYEFDLVQPADKAAHIGSKQDLTVPIDPLEYRFRAYSGRLIIRIYNPTTDPIELLGPKCAAVDPSGQSHPVRSQTIAPSSYAKFVLPPTRPTIQTGPTFGVGVGVGHVNRLGYIEDPLYDPLYDGPRYFDIYDDNNAYYWDWDGQTDVRLTLTFQRAANEFHHDFVFHRKKM